MCAKLEACHRFHPHPRISSKRPKQLDPPSVPQEQQRHLVAPCHENLRWGAPGGISELDRSVAQAGKMPVSTIEIKVATSMARVVT
eukprot:1425644-Amphidinium_carterae.1